MYRLSGKSIVKVQLPDVRFRFCCLSPFQRGVIRFSDRLFCYSHFNSLTLKTGFHCAFLREKNARFEYNFNMMYFTCGDADN